MRSGIRARRGRTFVCLGLGSTLFLGGAMQAASVGDLVVPEGATETLPGGLTADSLVVDGVLEVDGGLDVTGPAHWSGTHFGSGVTRVEGFATLDGATLAEGRFELEGGGVLRGGSALLFGADLVIAAGEVLEADGSASLASVSGGGELVVWGRIEVPDAADALSLSAPGRNEGTIDAAGTLGIRGLENRGSILARGDLDLGGSPFSSGSIAQTSAGSLHVWGDTTLGGPGELAGGAVDLQGVVRMETGQWRLAAPGQRLGSRLESPEPLSPFWVPDDGSHRLFEVAANGTTGAVDLHNTTLAIDGARFDVEGSGQLHGGAVELREGVLAVGDGLDLLAATLRGTGRVVGDVGVLAEPVQSLPPTLRPSVLAPGLDADPIGALVVQGDLLLSQGSRLEIELAGDGAGGILHDAVEATGVVDLGSFLEVSVLGDAAGAIEPQDRFVILEAGEALTGSFVTRSGFLSYELPSGSRVDAGPGTFRLFYGAESPFDADQVVLTGFTVPEPALAALLAAAAGILGRFRRRFGSLRLP